MSDIDYPIVGHKEKSAICNHCKHDYTGHQLEIMCMDENNNCQMCHAALSGKSLMIGVDMVDHPPHYKDASGIECIEVTKHMSFCGGSCFKYLYRCGKKHDDIEDLKKAAKYADWAWENEEVVPCEVLEDIWLISSHRSGNVSLAMDFIAEDMWVDAKKFIEVEIARLESEQ